MRRQQDCDIDPSRGDRATSIKLGHEGDEDQDLENRPTGRRAYWSKLLTGIASEIASDGCQDATPEVVDAIAVLFKYASQDVRQREVEMAEALSSKEGATTLSTPAGRRRRGGDPKLEYIER